MLSLMFIIIKEQVVKIYNSAASGVWRPRFVSGIEILSYIKVEWYKTYNNSGMV